MKTDQTLQISELFYSIQGESSFAGRPCAFIRLAGCNLRCTYCDAKYTYEEAAAEKTVSEVLAYAAHHHPDVLVEITGGEPLLQPGVYPLMEKLLLAGRTVLLETNGSIGIENVPGKVIRIVDVKCPGSGMSKHLDRRNLALLAPHDELKFVLSDRADYDWAKKILSGLPPNKEKNILFSPVLGKLDAAVLADWILKDELPVRLQLQLHTILWPQTLRGV